MFDAFLIAIATEIFHIGLFVIPANAGIQGRNRNASSSRRLSKLDFRLRGNDEVVC